MHYSIILYCQCHQAIEQTVMLSSYVISVMYYFLHSFSTGADPMYIGLKFSQGQYLWSDYSPLRASNFNTGVLKHIETEAKWTPFRTRDFQIHYLFWKCLNSDYNFSEAEINNKRQINNISALVQIMGWHRTGNKPLSVPIMISLLTHICVIRPQ